jgi:hypothetical protein
MANDLISFLRSKSAVLALIRDALLAANRAAVTVLRAVKTRWTSHFHSYCRLLVLRPTLEVVIATDKVKEPQDRIFFQGNAQARQTAEQMASIIRNPLFWYNLTRIKHHLSPLAIAANLTQATLCRLDDCFLALGFLFREINRFNSPEDLVLRDALLTSLNMRWNKTEREPFIMALVLNPLVKDSPLDLSNRLFSRQKLINMAKSLWY